MAIRIDLLAGLLLLASPAAAQVCTPTTPVAGQFRSAVTHRRSGASNGRTSSVAEMLHWSAPVNIADPAVRARADAIDPREQQRFTLTVDAWRVGLETADCDVSAEVSDPDAGPGGPRIVVRIPQESIFQPRRDALIAALPRGRAPARGGHVDLRTPIRIRVTGYAFFDSAHWSVASPQTGHGHGTSTVGTLWEIHPVQQLTVLASASDAGAATEALPTPPSVPGERADGGRPDTGREGPVPAANDHMRCCDGTPSTCLCDQGDFRGCCDHHRGICGGCGE